MPPATVRPYAEQHTYGGSPWGAPPATVRPYAEAHTYGGYGAPTPAPAAAPAAAGTSGIDWSLPTGTFDPGHMIRAEESERGLTQLEGANATSRSRGAADYYAGVSEIGRRQGQQTADHERARALLAQSYRKLGTRQEEGANQAGVLTGGALLQSAAKRAANEAQQQQTSDIGYGRQKEANDLALAKLAREDAPPDATNPLGGRHFQDLFRELTNAKENDLFFRKSEHDIAAQEAARNGVEVPSAPKAPAAKAAPLATPGSALRQTVVRPYAEPHTYGGRRPPATVRPFAERHTYGGRRR